MNGQVRMFNEERGFGFIYGDNGVDYFFHISSVKNVEPITRGTLVEFTPTTNAKGNAAKNVTVIQGQTMRPLFIKLGDTRIKLSNIKDYGIGVGYVPTRSGFLSASDYKEVPCLYITTFQGDEFSILEHEAPFSIYEKLDEIDKYFS